MFRTLIFLLWLCSTQAHAHELRIITSFPPSVSDAYVALWKSQNPETDVLVLNKNTVAAIDEIARGNGRGFDVFMASSPEAFELLSENGSFISAPSCGLESEDAVKPFALSSVGWTRRKESAVFMPGTWNDLLKPLYRGKIAMARPARSGSSHLMVEQLLQTRGWQDGWTYLLSLAGNLSTLTARSFAVPNGLIQGRFDIGLTIDFLAQSKSKQLDFTYGRPIMLTAAQVGLLTGGLAQDHACDFLRMVLSEIGQRLLLTPEISRIPISSKVRESADSVPIDVIDALRLEWILYDARLSAHRYWAVNALFDVMITETLAQRKSLWARLDQLRGVADPTQLEEIRSLLTKPVASEVEITTLSEAISSGLRTTRLTGISDDKRNAMDTWRAATSAQLQTVEKQILFLEQDLP